VRPLAPSRVDACNPLLQAHPTWARDKHEGRGISPLTPVSLWLLPPFVLRLAPTHLGWGMRRQFTRRSRDPPGSKRRQFDNGKGRQSHQNRTNTIAKPAAQHVTMFILPAHALHIVCTWTSEMGSDICECGNNELHLDSNTYRVINTYDATNARTPAGRASVHLCLQGIEAPPLPSSSGTFA
jgi:hypothetical protein